MQERCPSSSAYRVTRATMTTCGLSHLCACRTAVGCLAKFASPQRNKRTAHVDILAYYSNVIKKQKKHEIFPIPIISWTPAGATTPSKRSCNLERYYLTCYKHVSRNELITPNCLACSSLGKHVWTIDNLVSYTFGSNAFPETK